MGVVLALLSSGTWGVADFLGGLASRRARTVAVLAVAYPIGAVLLTLAGLFLIPGALSSSVVLLGIAAGISGASGIGLLYRALAAGPMGVVSPVTAVVACAVPVIVGLMRGDRLTMLALLGMAGAAVAIVLVSRERAELTRVRTSTVLISLASGALMGGYLAVIGISPVGSGIWPTIVSRWTSTLVMLIAFGVVAFRRHRRPELPLEVPFPWALVVVSGILDASANAMYQVATQHGMLAIVAVVGSLYPVTTVLLAWLVLRERLAAIQVLGVGIACASAAVLSVSS